MGDLQGQDRATCALTRSKGSPQCLIDCNFFALVHACKSSMRGDLKQCRKGPSSSDAQPEASLRRGRDNDVVEAEFTFAVNRTFHRRNSCKDLRSDTNSPRIRMSAGVGRTQMTFKALLPSKSGFKGQDPILRSSLKRSFEGLLSKQKRQLLAPSLIRAAKKNIAPLTLRVSKIADPHPGTRTHAALTCALLHKTGQSLSVSCNSGQSYAYRPSEFDALAVAAFRAA